MINQYRRAYAETCGVAHSTIGKVDKVLAFLKFLKDYQVYTCKGGVNLSLDYIRQFKKICIHSLIRIEEGFAYPFDVNIVRCIPIGRRAIASVTVDYNEIIKGCLKDKETEIRAESVGVNSKDVLLATLESIRTIIIRYIDYLHSHASNRNEILATYLQRMESESCASFEEALQRILFYNGLFWQCGHKQNGIGRLDLLLKPLYDKDINRGILTRSSAKELLTAFVKVIGKDTSRKSAALIGDTGQVIILGGVDANGEIVENEVSQMLLEIFTETPMPDPKLIYRTNEYTSDVVWTKITDCILKGSGSPLIMNESVIMPLMEKFGYSKDDIYNFGTSACWEPLIIGKSLDQNNCIKNITILDALTSTLKKYTLTSFQDLLDKLEVEITLRISEHNLEVKFDVSPLFSLFFDDCIEKGKDFGEGGAKYNYHGLLVVGLPNLVNSLLNIKEYVYERKICTIGDCLECIDTNYEKREDLRQIFVQSNRRFGIVDTDILDITNSIMQQIGNAVAQREIGGEKLKVGFSSPSYIGLAKQYPASLDGRRRGEPFAVHISPISTEVDIASILDFASMLQYEGCIINGNVVDFIIPSSYMKNRDKLMYIVKHACEKGLFELQLNVLDKATLIDAKQHPEKYSNLIVRVWGFSAYFNDLSEEYKNNLINRAELYE